VYITDTGNKRVVVFDGNGNFISEFGSYGMDSGQFDEPVGIAVAKNGEVYVADTWNQRIQVFTPDASGKNFTFSRVWSVDAWGNQSTENKPFLALDDAGNVFVTDPADYRVLEFSSNGQIIHGWGQYSSGIDGFGNPVGIAIDGDGHVWVMDSANNFAMRFSATNITSVPVNEIPAIPTAQITLTYDATKNELVDSANNAYYQLDTTNKIWVPIVPDSISQTFTEPLSAFQDVTNTWYLKTKAGIAVYQWDPNGLVWKLLSPIPATATN
jgi:sugar lactone lactonase YvrE